MNDERQEFEVSPIRSTALKNGGRYDEFAIIRPTEKAHEVSTHGTVVQRFAKITSTEGKLTHVAHLTEKGEPLRTFSLNLDHPEFTLENLRKSYDKADKADMNVAPLRVGHCSIERELTFGPSFTRYNVYYDTQMEGRAAEKLLFRTGPGLESSYAPHYNLEDGWTNNGNFSDPEAALKALHAWIQAGFCHVNLFGENEVSNRYYLDTWSWNFDKSKDIDTELATAAPLTEDATPRAFLLLLGAEAPLTVGEKITLDNIFTQPKTCRYSIRTGEGGRVVKANKHIGPKLGTNEDMAYKFVVQRAALYVPTENGGEMKVLEEDLENFSRADALAYLQEHAPTYGCVKLRK